RPNPSVMMSLNPQSPCPNGQRIEDPQSYFLSYLEGPVPSLQRMLSATASESAPITGNPNDKYLDKFPQVGYIQNGLQIGTDSVSAPMLLSKTKAIMQRPVTQPPVASQTYKG
ncbi:MAG: hypothetical protein MMC33_008839, partial [Icmadophila ericetorum]|nr:hypothetical protein [Icmadophila ericetorum]